MPRSAAVLLGRILPGFVLWGLIVFVLARLQGWYLRPYGPVSTLVLLGLPAVAAVTLAAGRRGWMLAVGLCLATVTALHVPGLLSPGGRSGLPDAAGGTWVMGLALGLLVARRALHWLLGGGSAADWVGNFHEVTLLGVVLWLFRPFLNPGFFGGIDALSYTSGLADTLAQTRAGIFPVLVGQSEFMFEGAIHPLRTAPYHHYLGILLDVATGRTWPVPAVQHLVVITSAALAALVCYGCLTRLVPGRRWTAWLLALMYVSSPAFLGFGYTLEMFLTVTAFSWLPVVMLANVRLYQADDLPTWGVLGAGLALVWYCHGPIALWLTALTVGLQGWRLALAPAPAQSAWRRAAVGGLGFIGLVAGHFWSVFEISAGREGSGGSREILATLGFVAGLVCSIRFMAVRCPAWLVAAVAFAAMFVLPPAAAPAALETLRSLWPANLAPVSSLARSLSDVQPGLGLLLAGVAGAILGRREGGRSLGVLAVSLLGFLALYYPVPGLTWVLLGYAPDFVFAISSVSVWQRTLPILVTVLAFTAMAGFSTWAKRVPHGARLGTGLLLCALGWNLSEAQKFIRTRTDGPGPGGIQADFLRPENLRQFAYVFPGLPLSPYLVNGVMDPHLESRLLDPADQSQVVAEPIHWEVVPWRKIVATPEPSNPAFYRLEPGIRLAPGERKALRFRFGPGGYDGVLVMRGSGGLYREYQFPEAGFGPLSFAVAPGRPKVLALWNDGGEPQQIEWHFARSVDKPESVPPTDFAEIAEARYDPATLPVRTDSLVPYRATATLLRPALLETPRVFIRGYRATVNGQAATVVESANHRVAVLIGTGENVVTVTYPGTLALRLAWIASLVCWLGGIAWLIWRRLGEKPESPA